MIAKPFIEFVHPDDREATLAEAAALFQGHTTIKFDNRYACKDGSYRWLAWTAHLDAAEDASRRLVYGTAHDVTPYRELLDKLGRTLARLRDTMQAMSTPLIPITDRIMVMPSWAGWTRSRIRSGDVGRARWSPVHPGSGGHPRRDGAQAKSTRGSPPGSSTPRRRCNCSARGRS